MRAATWEGVGKMTEERRNRFLRRVDWRFLLPNPVPARTVCDTDVCLHEALTEVLPAGSVHGTGGAPAAVFDLAVLVDPTQAAVHRAWAMLQPGGALYVECRYGGIRRLLRHLRRAGFTDLRVYAPESNPRDTFAQSWVPLDRGPALTYYLTYRNLSPFRFWLRAISRRLVPGAYPPWQVAVTGSKPDLTRPVADRPDFWAEILATICRHWPTQDGGPAPARLSWLLLTPGAHSTNKVVALIFGETSARPQIAVKMARETLGVAALQNEAAALRAVASQAPQLQVIPRVLFAHSHAGVMTVGETALTGTPLSACLTAANVRRFGLKAAMWLATLGRTTEAAADPEAWDGFLTAALTEFESTFASILAPGSLLEARARLRTIPPLPVVWEHRDYSPTNIVVTPEGELGVLDWESAARGAPFLDLLYFLTMGTFLVERAWSTGAFRQTYRASLSPATGYGQVVREAVATYTEQTGYDPAVVPVLRLLVWMIHAKSEYRRFVGRAGGRPPIEMLRGSLFVSLWDEQLRSLTGLPEEPAEPVATRTSIRRQGT